jgi:hypothetical protein
MLLWFTSKENIGGTVTKFLISTRHQNAEAVAQLYRKLYISPLIVFYATIQKAATLHALSMQPNNILLSICSKSRQTQNAP